MDKNSSKYILRFTRKSYVFGRTWGWVNDGRIFIFGWTISLKVQSLIQQWQFWWMGVEVWSDFVYLMISGSIWQNCPAVLSGRKDDVRLGWRPFCPSPHCVHCFSAFLCRRVVMRDGWFDHDSLSFTTKTHPCVSNGIAKGLNDFFSDCHLMHNWYFSIVVGRNHKGKF